MAGYAPYVNRSEAMNRRRGWSSLVVTQQITGHQLLCVQCVCECVCVCVLLCLVFIISVPLGNFLPIITAYITVHSKFCKVTQTILNPSVPEIRNVFQTAVTHCL